MRHADQVLEQQVKATLEAWAAEGALPEERLNALLRPVRRHRQIHARLTLLVGVAASILLLLAVPPVRVWAANTVARLPVIGQFIRRMADADPMWRWAEQHDAFQTIMAEASDQGFTVRLHQVLADPTQTTVIFTVEGERPLPASPGQDLDVMLQADGQRLGDRFGIRPEVVDGVLVVALETGPLPDKQARLTLDLFRIAETEGRWNLEVEVSRKSLSEVTQTVAIGRDWQLGELLLRIDRVLISPAQTVVEATGPGSGVDLFGSGFSPSLLADGQPLARRSVSGTASGGPMRYTLQFAPLPTGAKALTLAFPGYLMQVPVRTAVPLEAGVMVRAEGGWELRVDAVSREPSGKVETLLSYPHGQQDPWQPYDDWAWVDQSGRQHPLQPTRACEETRCALRFSIAPPEGKVPVLLQGESAWVKVQGPWETELLGQNEIRR